MVNVKINPSKVPENQNKPTINEPKQNQSNKQISPITEALKIPNQSEQAPIQPKQDPIQPKPKQPEEPKDRIIQAKQDTTKPEEPKEIALKPPTQIKIEEKPAATQKRKNSQETPIKNVVQTQKPQIGEEKSQNRKNSKETPKDFSQTEKKDNFRFSFEKTQKSASLPRRTSPSTVPLTGSNKDSKSLFVKNELEEEQSQINVNEKGKTCCPCSCELEDCICEELSDEPPPFVDYTSKMCACGCETTQCMCEEIKICECGCGTVDCLCATLVDQQEDTEGCTCGCGLLNCDCKSLLKGIPPCDCGNPDCKCEENRIFDTFYTNDRNGSSRNVKFISVGVQGAEQADPWPMKVEQKKTGVYCAICGHFDCFCKG